MAAARRAAALPSVSDDNGVPTANSRLARVPKTSGYPTYHALWAVEAKQECGSFHFQHENGGCNQSKDHHTSFRL